MLKQYTLEKLDKMIAKNFF